MLTQRLLADIRRCQLRPRMVKLQNRCFFETLTKKETNTGHQHKAYLYPSRFNDHLNDESDLFELVSRLLQKSNENKCVGTTSKIFQIAYTAILNRPPSVSPKNETHSVEMVILYNTDRDRKQIAFISLTHKFLLVEHFITVESNFATLQSSKKIILLLSNLLSKQIANS